MTDTADSTEPTGPAGPADISVSVQAEPADLDSWLALARRLEAAGFAALLMGDHPGNGASPWPALGAAAAVTHTPRPAPTARPSRIHDHPDFSVIMTEKSG